MARRPRWAKVEWQGTPLAELRVAFEACNRTANKSPRTVHWYNERLLMFERFVGPGAALRDLTVPTVRAFVADLQSRTQKNVNNPFIPKKDGKLASSYIQGIVRALRAFSSWLYEEGYTDANILQPLKPPKIQQKVFVALSDDEVGRLLASFSRRQPFGARNYAIFLTLLDCGLRASELCELSLGDSPIEQGYLKILGKGNKERLTPIGHACQEALQRWRDRFRPLFNPVVDRLFVGTDGGNFTINALESMVRKAGTRAGIDRLHCHLLRHTFATNYLVKQIGDPLRLQQILGHTSLEMVRRYVSVASIQQSVIDRRTSAMDLILHESAQPRRHAPRKVKTAARAKR
jgi:site-specific recombinase XerD